MGQESAENTCGCPGGTCGCHIDAYATDRACPECHGKLRVTGQAQRMELRLTCSKCGYASPMLSLEEIGDLI